MLARLLGDFRATLGTKLLVLLLTTAIVPAALLAFLSITALHRVGDLAAARGSRALADQARAALQQLAVQAAAHDDLIFARASADALTIAADAGSRYDDAPLVPAVPGWDARQRLVRGRAGELLAAPDDRFGVYVPPSVPLDDDLVNELNLIARLDPLLESRQRNASYQSAAYVVLADRSVRVYPRLEVSRPGVDPTTWPAFVAAGPPANPIRQVVWTAPHLDDFTASQPVISAAAPIFTKAGEFKGVAAVDVPLSPVVAGVLAAQAGPAGHAFLVDAQGRVIAASEATRRALGLPDDLAPDLQRSSDPAGRAIAAVLGERSAGVSTLASDGRELLVAHAPLATTGWSLVLMRPHAEVVQTADDTAATIRDIQAEYLKYLQIFTAIVLAGVTVAAVLAARAFSWPIRLLTLSTRRIAAGDLSHRVPVLSADEIGELASEFNLMARRLAELNAGLEAKVAERTKQLVRRAEQLRTINEIGRQITSILALDELLPSVVRTLLDAFHCVSVAIFLREGSTLRLRALATHGQTGPALGIPWPAESIVGWVAAQGKPLLANDVSREPRYRPAPGLPAVGAELAVPIVVGRTCVGVLTIQAAEVNAFEDDDLASIQAIADQIAIAMENARLFAESRGRATLEERNRLAREIHDGLAQQLTGIVLQLEASDQLMATKPDRAHVRLRKALDLARDALQEARRSVWNLRATPLEAATLGEAIRREAQRFAEETGVVLRLETDGVGRLPPEVENCLFRVAQEAFNNIRKHARATAVEVSLAVEDGAVRLRVQDDGVGFDPTAPADGVEKRQGFGLVGMRERVQLVGGQIALHSAPGRGTAVTVVVPIHQGDQ